ncbi:MAG: putative indolepyruvate:ferredoxin oxidoreductase oxidoreductase protein [Bradyrhizobium sp.]|nr:putative indolepyruvate:ferredoxin oxidoreductase oxidoreductase protein [Bradyrhizobium sp.]
MKTGVQPLTISLHALGGQGGGVLADWLIAIAREAEWIAQSTSVPGVAQRTGATVYYIELFPQSAIGERQPVLALMPMPGDVDLVVASELMEAGRAINRGLVTERTTLVASTSRVYAISEKSGMGDGRFADAPVVDQARAAARHLVAFDMEAEAVRTGSVISAVLLGAIAGSGALPFSRESYEAAIRAAGIAVATNLAGFAAGYDGARTAPAAPAPVLLARSNAFVIEGERRLIDYQDAAYAALYRDRLARFADLERPDGLLTRELARYLALWMSYEDTARVADLKTRSARFTRVRQEVGATPGQVVHITEYLHPRLEELCDTMPASLGRFVLRTPWLSRLIARLFARGRHVTTSRLGGFLLLYVVGSLRRWRRSSLRYAHENAKIEAWLDRALLVAARDYPLAVEIARCQRLIKGYGDTYDRGWRNFGLLMTAAESVDAATLARLRTAALGDDEGRVLGAAIAALGEGTPTLAAVA